MASQIDRFINSSYIWSSSTRSHQLSERSSNSENILLGISVNKGKRKSPALTPGSLEGWGAFS
jgi:hypothetical protein